MTKKHFIELADTIRRNRGAFQDAQIEILADFCRSQNYNFKRDRWLGYIRGENGQNGGAIKGA